MTSKGCSARLETKAAMMSENSDREAGEQESAVELRYQFLLEKKGGEADANLAEGRALALHWQGDLINARRGRRRHEAAR